MLSPVLLIIPSLSVVTFIRHILRGVYFKRKINVLRQSTNLRGRHILGEGRFCGGGHDSKGSHIHWKSHILHRMNIR